MGRIDELTLSVETDGEDWTYGVHATSVEGVGLAAVVADLLGDEPWDVPDLRVHDLGVKRAGGRVEIVSRIALPEGLAIDLRDLPLVRGQDDERVDEKYLIELETLALRLIREPSGERTVALEGVLLFAGKREPLALQATPDGEPPAAPRVLPAGRTIGPLTVDSLAVDFDGGELHVRVNARLGRAGLAIEVLGLRLTVPLADPSAYEFAIDGLAITYDIPPVRISGGLRGVEHPEWHQFDGSLSIRAGDYGLTAIGSYATSRPPSLFAFLQVLAPIGGPPSFYVKGLAGGFGMNRALRLPGVDALELFPFIQGSRGQAPFDPRTTVGAAIAKLDEYVDRLDGRDWVVAGVTVGSFGLIETQALLTLSFGGRLEIGLLGMATLRLPEAVHARMALRTVISPSVGELSAVGRLTSDSYVLHPDCKLTGGFAIGFWFDPHEHAGDFVVTLGGYHPGFVAPPHYPNVPRLGVAWSLDGSPLSIKGSQYFALTPAQMMLGGVLEANWDAGPIRARFAVEADFLAGWAPFSYSLTAGVTFAVDARLGSLIKHTFSINVGAELSLWGPELSGRAHVDLGVMGFTIEFGKADEHPPDALGFDDFAKQVFGGQGLRVQVRDGLLGTTEEDVQVVDPERLTVVTETVIPSKEAELNGEAQAIDCQQAFGIAPMKIASDDLTSVHTVKISKCEGGRWVPYTRFAVEPLTSTGPRALWGEKPTLNGERTIKKLLTGLRLTPRGETGRRTKELDLDGELVTGPAWAATPPRSRPVARAGDPFEVVLSTIVDPKLAERRSALLGDAFTIDVSVFEHSRQLGFRAPPTVHGFDD